LDFNPALSWEFLSSDEIAARTVRALRNQVGHVMEVSPWYRKSLAGIDPADITDPASIAALPCTTKRDLAGNLDSFYAVPANAIAETVVTSGSTGNPLIFPLTRSDLDRLAFNEALSFHGAGVTPNDRAQILVSLDRLFIAGMAYYRGLTLLGANTTRIGVLPFEMQKLWLQTLNPTVLVGVPSFLVKLGTHLVESGWDAEKSAIRTLVCIGESVKTATLEPNAVSRQLQELFGAQVLSTYGVTELSVAYCECTQENGGHSHPELVHTEIVDDAGNPCPDGEVGELVVTTFGVEALPLIRYKTGDMTFKVTGTCTCGRNSSRIGPILARKSQMIKIKGTTVYPLTLTNAVDEIAGVADYCFIIEGSTAQGDSVVLHVAGPPNLTARIATQIQARARVSIPVLISNETTINGMRKQSRKKIRIIDNRIGQSR